MQYSEEKAFKLQKSHNVNPSTVRGWKHRNIIPDKYNYKLVSLSKLINKKLNVRWYIKFFHSLSSDQKKEFALYKKRVRVPQNLEEDQIKQRLRDFRTWIKNK